MKAIERLAKRAGVCGAALIVGTVLAGCTARQDHPKFVTNATVNLRDGEADDAAVVARLARGTLVVPVGTVGGECMCWKVSTPKGTGWLYQRYIELK